MKNLIPVSLLLILSLSALAEASDPVLQRAFERADREEIFLPYSCSMESHVLIHKGRNKKQREEINRANWEVWSPDSIKVSGEEREILFQKEEEEEKRVEMGKGGGESRSFDVLDEGRRSLYRFEAKGLELFNERELHRYDFEPLKKAKDLWEGSLWIDSETGLLASVDAGLSKKSFGLKAFSMNMDFIDWEGMSLARQLTMEIHVKVPLLANMRIRTESKFRDFQRIPVP
ncbi:MAG: hypothetical protein QF492_02780 [Candidatus Krumholzibacteria bacterium]|jgi:hypothetical protein|nr:hypothetical protein [Candidatus Krumholzibacteria bacterium]MDP6668823.1 hypothetical protein [Candidatus Krumholzibacteria bacterium]MDP6796397.1 hypothetical protein [Candidatus Krumholzibacteria bacterium]MDP7022032.1 hypothetical protein [Candidatus Krumholzibacteria bacterium]